MVAPAPRTLSVTFSIIITSFVDSTLEMWGFERSWFTVFCWLADPISHLLWKWETPSVKVLGCVLRPSFLFRRSKEACVLLRVLRICTSQRELWPLGEGPNVFLVGKHRRTHMKRGDCCWMLFVEGTEPKAISLLSLSMEFILWCPCSKWGLPQTSAPLHVVKMAGELQEVLVPSSLLES